MIRKDNVLEVEHLGGGKGTAYVHHIVSKEELLGHGRLYAKDCSSSRCKCRLASACT